MGLIRLVKSWDYPDLLRQSPEGDGAWGNWRFTTEEIDVCDGLLILNYPKKSIEVRCPTENVWALFQEPDVPGSSDWMREGHSLYARVFTHAPLPGHARYVLSQPAVPWHVGRSYRQLSDQAVPDKTEEMVWITSNLQLLSGHRRRIAFLEHARRWDPDERTLSIYGRGIRPIEEKWDVLAPARYALAVENIRQRDYWTEKLADCFLSWTLPLYDGCPNIGNYFPEDAMIRVDMGAPDAAWDRLRALPGSGEWDRRLPALREARRLVLERYQFFPWVAGLVQTYYRPGPPLLLDIPPWRPRLSTRFRNLGRRWRIRIKRGFGKDRVCMTEK